MKNRTFRTVAAICLMAAFVIEMALPVSAAQPDYSKEIADMDKWLDGLTLSPSSGKSSQSAPANPSGSDTAADTSNLLTEDELKAYADKVFELVNKAREDAGVPLLERDSRLDEAAAIRATEIQSAYDKYGTAHRRLDGEDFKDIFSQMGIKVSSWGENAVRQRKTPESAMKAWMQSDGHKANILKEKYTSVGIGVYQHPNGNIDWVQLFMLEK